ncbi:hypothetical protein GIB67_007579 [Kingdonia uniflora]|uniref:Uncharacterized protein n=1 Tax=Kingdonia uniflora TaxID=39325 RepID=A0A7J7N1Z1_9MAGN|nr:hypothetical protein GIB67_007579 [Kingdonia uniflora]
MKRRQKNQNLRMKSADEKQAEKPQAKAVTSELVAVSSKPPAAAPAAPAPAPAPAPVPILAYLMAQPYVAYPIHYHDGVYGGTPYYEGYGGNRGYDHYNNEYSEENPSCNIM